MSKTGMEVKKYKDKCQNLEKEVERLRNELKAGQTQFEAIKGRGFDLAKKAKDMETRLTADKQELEVFFLYRTEVR